MSQINVLFTATVKEGKEDEFYNTANDIMTSSNAEDDGCITFTFHQHAQNPREFFCYEQWRDQSAFEAHFARLAGIYGAPREGEVLPAKLADYFETMNAELYDVCGKREHSA